MGRNKVDLHFLIGWVWGRDSRSGVVVITTAELHYTMSCAGSNPARGVLEICNGENL